MTDKENLLNTEDTTIHLHLTVAACSNNKLVQIFSDAPNATWAVSKIIVIE